MQYSSLFAALLLFVTCQNGTPTAERTPEVWSTFILVRHAEKSSDPQDPDLTQDGYRRAQKLTRFLAGSTIHAVYASRFQRTRLTAEPTARSHSLEILPYDQNRLGDFVTLLLNKHLGQSVLIVGHSNTTPDLANLLVGQALFSHFDDSDYDSIILVTCREDGACSARRYLLTQ